MLRIGVQWFLNKSGPCSTSFLEAGGFAKSSPEREYPNIQFHFFPAFVIDHGLVDPDRHGYQLHASPNHPKSRGSDYIEVLQIPMIIQKYYLIILNMKMI